MEVGAFEVQRGQLFVGYDDAGGVGTGVESCANFQSGFGSCVGNPRGVKRKMRNWPLRRSRSTPQQPVTISQAIRIVK